MENQKLKTARELIRSPYLTPSQAMQILMEVGRHKGTDVPEYRDLPDLLMTGFIWSESLKGEDYWKKIFNKIQKNPRTIKQPYPLSRYKFTRIKPPTYRIGRHVLNEYELRNLQIEVARGEKEPGMIVKDEKGNVATILPNGGLDNYNFSNDLYGLSMNTEFKFVLLKLKMNNEKHN